MWGVSCLSRFGWPGQVETRSLGSLHRWSIHTPRITLTLFSPLPCPPSSTHRPPVSPQPSQTTQTRRYSSRITSILYKLRSAQCARWHTKRSVPCAFSRALTSPQLDIELFFPSADDDIVLLVRVPTSPDRHPHMRPVSTYFSSLT